MAGRRLWVWLVATVVAAVSLARAPDAAAQSTQVRTRFVDRELTLPKLTLRVDDGPYWPIPSGLVETTFVDTGDDRETFWGVNAGAGIGVIENLELGAHVINATFDPNDLHDPSVYGLFRFLNSGGAELGVYAELKLPFETDVSLLAGMPVALHVGNVMRLDTGPFILFPNRSGDDPDFIAPLQLPINLGDQLYLGPEAFVFVPDFEEAFFGVVFFLGYTMTADGGMLGDVGGRFRMPSVEDGMDVFQIMFEMSLHFDL